MTTPALSPRWEVAEGPAAGPALAFLVGLALPVLTLQTGYYGTPVDWSSRVAAVDVLCAATLLLFFLRGRLAPVPWPGVIYVAAVGVSLVPGLVLNPGNESDVWTAFVALLMAFGFYVLGLTYATSPGLMRAFLAGSAAAVLAESVICYHDYFWPSQWFPDPMPGRARGTFKANGQLGAYGFCMAGILAAFGATQPSARARRLYGGAAFLAASLVFLASRRMGMLCVFLWWGLFLVAGAGLARRTSYRVLAAGFLLALLGIAASWERLAGSFAGRRFAEAVRSVKGDEGFIQSQLRHTLDSADRWFPAGFGPGKGRLINPRDVHEVHNGHLAVLVEIGLAAFVGYAGMVLLPLLARPRRPWTGERRRLYRAVVASFLLACIVFAFHNTLYRDRTFLFFLGAATAVALGERAAEEKVA
ncbi:MAG TPA: hypothetical protein VEJ18_12770 [Planctomycetota bacterium]|nr:hypothetical protein [Planctomycetota bacterium]